MASPSGFEDFSSDDDSSIYLEPLSGADLVDTDTEEHNLSILAVHNIALRIGWLFKTESVIIPACLDQLSGAGWVRGLLPVLHRIGGSVPPIVFARRLTRLHQKKWAMLAMGVVMASVFFVLGLLPIVLRDVSVAWQIVAFLTLYTIFWVSSGILKLTYGTLQAKLIRPFRRGALLRISMFVGTIPAIVVAWLLLGHWLQSTDRDGFTQIFWFAAACFLSAGVCGMMLKEQTEDGLQTGGTTTQWLQDALIYLQKDKNLCWTITIGMLLSSILITLPHYQAMARQSLDLGRENLTTWVVIQSIGTGLAGLLAGTMADRYGNRIVLRLGIFTAALIPALAAVLLRHDLSYGRPGMVLLFFLIGFVPPTLRILANYVLEISPQREAPRYLGLLAFGTVLPFALSPVIGWWIDQSGFQPAFLFVAILVAIAGVLTFVLKEPKPHVDMSDMKTEYLL